MVALRACLISSVSVETTMPSVTGGGAGRLQLGHLLDAHHAHAARGLKREAGVVTERRNLDARRLAGVNEQRARRRGELFAIDGESYVSHCNLFPRA